MNKSMKYALSGVSILSALTLLGLAAWVGRYELSSAGKILIPTSLVIWLLTSFAVLFLENLQNASTNLSKADKFKHRADNELCSAIVEVNNLHHLMISDTAHKAELKEAYLKAREVFRIKAEMYDSIFLCKTVIVDSNDENGNITEVTFESIPR